MTITQSTSCWAVSLDKGDEMNSIVLDEYQAIRQDPDIKKTHFFGGRYENIYLSIDRIPSLKPVLIQAKRYAAEILDLDETQLQIGFWFNEMYPGHETTLHTHDEDDELLSGAYYLQVPKESGQLILHDANTEQEITPTAGSFIFFKPQLPHAVGKNKSNKMRLSIGMNIGLLKE